MINKGMTLFSRPGSTSQVCRCHLSNSENQVQCVEFDVVIESVIPSNIPRMLKYFYPFDVVFFIAMNECVLDKPIQFFSQIVLH
jgi:hypothetical protein